MPLVKNVKIDWLLYYSYMSGINNHLFVPESVYYSIIEPILNDFTFHKSYSDKNFYDQFYGYDLFPETLFRKIDGKFYDKSYKSLSENALNKFLNFGFDSIVVKPALDSGGGRGVELFIYNSGVYLNKEGVKLNAEYFKNKSLGDIVVQRKIKQVEFLSSFNESSVNTIRVLTYKSVRTGQIHILQAILRIGKSGEFVDNSNAGGYSIGINKEGTLNKFAIDKSGNKFFTLHNIDFSNSFTVPFFDKVIEAAKFIAERNLHHSLLGLDLIICDDFSVKCIEVNNAYNEINFFQCNNGPLFEPFTEEILKYCIENKSKLKDRIFI